MATSSGTGKPGQTGSPQVVARGTPETDGYALHPGLAAGWRHWDPTWHRNGVPAVGRLGLSRRHRKLAVKVAGACLSLWCHPGSAPRKRWPTCSAPPSRTGRWWPGTSGPLPGWTCSPTPSATNWPPHPWSTSTRRGLRVDAHLAGVHPASRARKDRATLDSDLPRQDHPHLSEARGRARRALDRAGPRTGPTGGLT